MTDLRFAAFPLLSHDLQGSGSWFDDLRKVAAPEQAPSNQGSFLGRREHLLDYDAVADLKDYNVHHSTCLETKTRAAVGLGHKNAEVAKVLDPLCEISWQDTLDAVASDYFEFGNGYLEVVRDVNGAIVGLYHIPAKDIWVYVEENRNTWHYEVTSRGDFAVIESLLGLRFARFGDRDDFIRRRGVSAENQRRISEVIHFPLNRGRRSPHYGISDWIAGTPAMELDQCVTQYAFDFFFNGGMPEALFTVIGNRMDPDDWEALKKSFQAHQGIGKRRKLMLLNLHDPDMKAQLDKLTLDGQTTGDNQALVDDQALKIVSAHRVPPLLAGIQIPGKLGAANEMSNSIMAFQTLVISHAQKKISTILATTLGHPELGVDGLDAGAFLGEGTGEQEVDQMGTPDPTTGISPTKDKDNKGNGFNTIVDEINLGEADTISRMRTSVAEATVRGRDLSAGPAERGGDIEAGRGSRS